MCHAIISHMKLSICITSCNRLKYTRALIESLSEFFENDEVEILVCDMWSTELGLKDYLKKMVLEDKIHVVGMSDDLDRDWINDEYIGRNMLIDHAKGDYLMFLQDDGQFISNADVLWEMIDDFEGMPDAYCLEIYGVRKQTMRSTVHVTPTMVNERKYWKRKDRHFPTTGIYKRSVYNQLGRYPTDWPTKKEFWGRSETWYAEKFKHDMPDGHVYRVHTPVMLSIWNDPRGGYAFIRENKRFGHYLDPVGPLYYERNLTKPLVDELNKSSIGPVSIMDIVKPIGWEMAVTSDGEQLKYNQWNIMEKEGPFEELP